VQSIAFFVIDVDIQQNAFLLDTIFSGADSDHPCAAFAAQAAARYAMENTGSYVRSNIAQLVNRSL
jgi:hypothetical protein